MNDKGDLHKRSKQLQLPFIKTLTSKVINTLQTLLLVLTFVLNNVNYQRNLFSLIVPYTNEHGL